MKPRKGNNSKRKIKENPDQRDLEQVVEKASYECSTDHKKYPIGTPGFQFGPRPDATLCDSAGVTTVRQATRLLRTGARRGLVSEQTRGGFPQNIWSVDKDGCPFESELTNQRQGVYHGYPMGHTDPFREEVLQRWREIDE